MGQKTLLALLLAAIPLVAVSCGGDGDGGPTGPSANAPVVSNFSIRPLTPERANRQVQYLITATVVDPNNDLMGGRVEWQEPGQTLSLAINGDVLQGSSLAIVAVTNPLPPGTYTANFVVFDAAGNGSVPIPVVINIRIASTPDWPGQPEPGPSSAAKMLVAP